MSNNFTLLCSKERHVIKWGCINTYLRSQVCSIHSLACKTSSHHVAWWISATWSSVPILSMQMSPFCWWSLMKWWRTTMCFVLVCWTGLLVSFTALSLSHSNGTCLKLIPKSFNVAFIHKICAQQLPAAMYSTLAVDSATLFCFLDDHETSDLPNSWHVPDVLLLSTLHPA